MKTLCQKYKPTPVNEYLSSQMCVCCESRIVCARWLSRLQLLSEGRILLTGIKCVSVWWLQAPPTEVKKRLQFFFGGLAGRMCLFIKFFLNTLDYIINSIFRKTQRRQSLKCVCELQKCVRGQLLSKSKTFSAPTPRNGQLHWKDWTGHLEVREQ